MRKHEKEKYVPLNDLFSNVLSSVSLHAELHVHVRQSVCKLKYRVERDAERDRERHISFLRTSHIMKIPLLSNCLSSFGYSKKKVMQLGCKEKCLKKYFVGFKYAST